MRGRGPEEDLVEGGDLSQSEMEEVLVMLRSRASPTGRRPSLKDDPATFLSQEMLPAQQAKSRRSSVDEIFDPSG